MSKMIRNIAIIAHVDHGKTTLVDCLLQQSGTLKRNEAQERVMDSNDLEKERGITILAKNTAVRWKDYQINILDTPGHADFGGEVERVLSMVDCVLLVVDAVEGPMPQTRFVTRKAFAAGLSPIVVVNKIDRPGARPGWVVDQVFDLFDSLGATEEQMDFPVIYTSAIQGYALREVGDPIVDMSPLFETVIEKVPAPVGDENGPFQMQISLLDYSSYVGTIGIGRITRGQVTVNQQVVVVSKTGEQRSARVLQVLGYSGLHREEIQKAGVGDIIAVTGAGELKISDTLCDKSAIEPLPPLTVDAPTIRMTFQVNNSPFVGKAGKFVTSRHLRERLKTECLHNVALLVEETADPDKFEVSGRGELHLSILIETMRREGYELAVTRPQVILREVDGVMQEPYEQLSVDIEEAHQGAVMAAIGERKGTLTDMIPMGQGRVRLDFDIPTRGLIGLHTSLQTVTSGSGIITHVFDRYDVVKPDQIVTRTQGVLIASCPGKTTAYALFHLQPRGKLFIGAQTMVYEGMIVGLHQRDSDLVVNVTKEKHLSNVRNTGSEEQMILVTPVKFSLEQALTFIQGDELVEITPDAIRLRKRGLTENDRKRTERG